MSGDVTPYLNKITSEHSSKPKFMAMVMATVQPAADLQALLRGAVTSLYDLNSAYGKQLDVVGQWVGLSRQLAAPITGVYFAFDTAGVGFDYGVWQGPYDPTSGLVSLPDDYYRLALNARILNNSWDGTKDHFYNLAQALFGPLGYFYYIEDLGAMSMNIGLSGPTAPSPLLVAMINAGILDSKPVAVQIINRIVQQGPIFAFDLNNANFAGLDRGYWATSI
jgi:hypothetical protein